MESGERLASPSAAPSSLLSAPAASAPATAAANASPPNPPSKSSLAASPATLGSTLTTCGHVFRAGSDQPFTVSSAFPMVSHHAFGLHTSSAGRSEFGGLGSLGSLGMSAALAAHPQLASFPEWWRASELHGRGAAAAAAAAAAFFPPLLGLPPLFTPPVPSPDPSGPFQSRTPTKNGRASSKGLNGTINGSGGSGGAGSTTPSPALGAAEPTKATGSSARSRKNNQELSRTAEKLLQKSKEKKLRKKAVEISSNSDSESGSSSDSSSDGVSSSDLDDLEDDDEEDEDDDDQSNDSEDSDLEKERPVNRKVKPLSPSDSPKVALAHTTGDKPSQDQIGGAQAHGRPLAEEGPLSARFPLQSSPKPPALLFAGSRSREQSSPKHHRSVIQATGLAVSSKPLSLVTQARSEAPPVPLVSSPKPRSLSSSPKPLSLSSSPKPPSVSSSSPKPLSLSSSPKPLSHASSPRPPSLSSSPKPPTLSPSHKPKASTASPRPPGLADSLKTSSRSFLDETLLQINNLKMKQPFLSQEHFKQAFPLQQKSQQESSSLSHKSQKKLSSSSSTLSSSSSLPLPKLSSSESLSGAGHKLLPPYSCHSNLFLAGTLLGGPRSPQPNGVIQSSVQEAPLALITKPRGGHGRTPDRPLLAATSPPFSTPVNLTTTGTREHSLSATPAVSAASAVSASATPGPATSTPRSRKGKPSKVVMTVPVTMPSAGPPIVASPAQQSHLVQSLVDLFRGTESDIPSSKDSNDSAEDEDDWEDDEDEDDDDDDDDDEDSDSQSDSESNLSDTDASEGRKERSETATDTETERTPLKLAKASALLSSSSSLSAGAGLSPLNLQVIKAPSVPMPTIVTNTATLAYHSTPTSSFAFSPPPGSGGRRKRVTDERELRIPLEFGWQREVRIRSVGGRLQGDVAYYAPCGKKLRQYPDVVKYLARNGICDITRDNFSFSAKIKVGDFYEAREGPEGLQWVLLKEEEIIPRILAMEGRRGRPRSSEHLQQQQQQSPGEGSQGRRRKGRPPNVGPSDFPSPSEAKLLRKLEAQEIARQAAQIKLMRKLEKQAMARAAKEARKQQAIMAAEEKRRQKEQMKILKQQEKIKRIQQIRMEKELRAQQILEAKRKKKEEAANAKILEAEKRIKEKEMRRQQAVILKHQELERLRLDMVWERERRRQHMMLMKAVEARKKAEEKERVKQEKRDEKRLNKERKLELRRLELEMARELKKPNEDMCLADHKPLPEFCRVPGLLLPGATFSECLMVLQFLRSFGHVLGMDPSADVPGLGPLQEGLLNVGPASQLLQDLLVRMLTAAVADPGLPPGHRAKTALGEHLTNVGINRDNVSEILQIYMDAHCGPLQTDLAALAQSLRTKAFQAHTPAQKASILAFLVNELACSKSVVSEIDKNIDHMTNLRRDKWVIEGKLRKLRSIYAKRTGKKEGNNGGEETPSMGTPSAGRKRKRKGGDSDDDEDEDEDSDEDEDDDDDEDVGKRGKKVETCDDEDEVDQSASVEDLEKQIEKLAKQQIQMRRKLFESSGSLRSMMFGQDRYKRRYWVLPQCGGIFVEGMESGEGAEELEKERERARTAEQVQVKEEPAEDEEMAEEEDKPPLGVAAEVKQERETPTPERQAEADSLNLFLQKPGSFSKLSKLLEVAKMSPELTTNSSPSRSHDGSPTATGAASGGSPTNTPTTFPSSPLATPGGQSALVEAKPDLGPVGPPPLVPGGPYLNGPGKGPGGYPQPLLPNDQLFRVLTEKSGHWFSLLPRSPCDSSSLTASLTPPPPAPPAPAAISTSTSTSPTQSGPATLRPKSPSSLSPNPPPAASTTASLSPGNPSSSASAINNFPLSPPQVKSGMTLMGMPFCAWPPGMLSPNLHFPGTSPLPSAMGLGMGMAYPSAEGNGNPFLTPSAATSKSESPGPLSDKLPSVPSPAIEVTRPPDHPAPHPIPEEMLTGWWKLGDQEDLRCLVKALHSRGIREKALQKQFQKHMDYITQCCAKHREVSVIDEAELEENQVTEETLESWCVEEQAMEVDIAVLQQVEELERRVTSASLQAKGWMFPEPQSEQEDLVYHEHKPLAKLSPTGGKASGEDRPEGNGGIVRRLNNPLDLAVARLAELERNIERSGQEDLAPGMKVWRKALSEVRSAAQLALCIQQLQKSIAWERSIMKVFCQICRKGDNEELLLLCDGCDKGCHTYCHRPKITTIPDGDWFCPACISKASDHSPNKNKKQQSRAAAGAGGASGTAVASGGGGGVGGAGAGGNCGGGGGAGKKSTEVKKNRKPSEASEEDAASTSSSTPKKGAKETKKRKAEESPASTQPKQDGPASAKKGKIANVVQDNERDLTLCRMLLAELESHPDAWPFLSPVNVKAVPGYRKVIKKPMDLSTIREKIVNNQYLNLETFIIDVNLIFDNCEKFNEDNSEIGRAGHSMRKFFEKRWPELLKQTTN